MQTTTFKVVFKDKFSIIDMEQFKLMAGAFGFQVAQTDYIVYAEPQNGETIRDLIKFLCYTFHEDTEHIGLIEEIKQYELDDIIED
jgi:hypothetical protein